MEQGEEKIIAIMEFLSNYDPQITMKSLLSGESFYELILELNDANFDFRCPLNESPSTWIFRLDNFEMILNKIEEYFEVIHHKCLQTSKIDLIELCKNESVEQLINFFEFIMCLIMQSPHKEKHIQNIMDMSQSFQEHFVSIIQNSIDPTAFSERRYHRNNLRKALDQFVEEKKEMEREIFKLTQINAELTKMINEEKLKNFNFQQQIEEKQSQIQHNEQNQGNLKCLEQYIQKLKERIISNMKQYENQKLKFTLEIRQLEERLSKEDQFEQLNLMYKEKYQEIMDQMQKVNIWKKQKSKMQKNMEEKNYAIKKLYEKLQEQSDANLALEEKQLKLNFEMEKKNRKIKKLSQDLKKAIEGISNYNNQGFQSFLDHSVSYKSNISLTQEEDEINKVKKSNEKLLKQNRNNQKQISKLEKKVEKLRFLEEDKKRLELLVYELRNTQSQELKLLTAVFYDTYKDSLDVMKNVKRTSSTQSNQKRRRVTSMFDQNIKRQSTFTKIYPTITEIDEQNNVCD